MREILFKAKRDLGNTWIYGSHIYATDGFGNELHEIIKPTREKSIVNPETICQYTGLTDKNGVKIFEGDIILSKDTGYKAIVEWQSDTCRFLAMITNRRNETSPHFFYVDKGSDRGCQMSSSEVIGNIFDNTKFERIETE